MSEKLKFREKLAYACGDMGCNFVWTTVSMFLTLYYTDSVGISAAVAGTIMLITRLLDGVTDLCFGTILDRTHTRWGKARPWVLWSTPMMVVGLILLFNVPSGFSTTGKTVYATITYIFVAAIAYTASNLSYNALLSLMTDNQQDRTSASSIRFICTFLTAIVLSSITMPLVNKLGWGVVAILYGFVSLLFFMITFFGTKERYVEEKKETGDANISVLEGFKMLFKNRYFYSITLLFVAVYMANGLGGVNIYFAREVLKNENVMGLLTMAQMLPMIFFLPLFPVLSKRFGKWKVMMAGLVVMIIGCAIVTLFPMNLTAVLVGTAVKGLGMAPNSAGLFALVADGVFFGEWKNGIRQDGLFNSATSFGMKVGTGIGSAMVGWGLALSKYDATAAVQSAQTVGAIKIMYSVLPMIILALALVSLAFSNIDKIYPQIEKDLQGRKENA